MKKAKKKYRPKKVEHTMMPLVEGVNYYSSEGAHIPFPEFLKFHGSVMISDTSGPGIPVLEIKNK